MVRYLAQLAVRHLAAHFLHGPEEAHAVETVQAEARAEEGLQDREAVHVTVLRNGGGGMVAG